MDSIFVEAWKIYTKQVTDNLITQRLQRYSIEKISTEATEDSHMEIYLDTTADQRQLQYIIKKQALEETKIFVGDYIVLNKP